MQPSEPGHQVSTYTGLHGRKPEIEGIYEDATEREN